MLLADRYTTSFIQHKAPRSSLESETNIHLLSARSLISWGMMQMQDDGAAMLEVATPKANKSPRDMRKRRGMLFTVKHRDGKTCL